MNTVRGSSRRVRDEETFGLCDAFTLVDEERLEGKISPETAQQDFESEPPHSMDIRAKLGHGVVQRWLAKVTDLEFEGKPKYMQLMEQALDRAEMFAGHEVAFHRKHAFKLGEVWMVIAQVEVKFRRLQWYRSKPELYMECAEKLLEAKVAAAESGSKRAEAYALVLLARIYRTQEMNSTCWKVGNDAGKTVRTLEKAIDILETMDTVEDNVLCAKAKHFLGDALSLQNDFLDGMCALRDAHERFRQSDRTRYEALELLFMACHFLSKNKPKEAVLYSEDALEILLELDSPRGNRYLATALQVLCKAHILRLDVSSAQRLAAEWIDLFRERDDIRGLVRALMTLAETYEGYTNLGEAAMVYEEAVAAAEELGDARLLHDVLVRFGMLQRGHNKLSEADPLCRRAVDCAREAQDRMREASALDALNVVLMDRMTFEGDEYACDEFMRNVQEQKAIYDSAGDMSQAAHVMLTHVAFLTAFQQLEDAIAVAEEAKSLFVKAKDKEGETVALSYIAEVQLDLTSFITDTEDRERRRNVSINLVDSMRVVSKDSRDQLVEAKAEAFAVNIYLCASKKKEAINMCRDALRLIKKCGSPEEVFHFMILLVDAHTMNLNPVSTTHVKIMDRMSKEALELARMMRKPKHIAHALLRRVHVDVAQSAIEEGMKDAAEALKLSEEVGDEPLKSRIMSYIAYLHFLAARKPQAVDAVTAAYEVACQYPNRWDSDMAKETCAKVLEQCGECTIEELEARTLNKIQEEGMVPPTSRPVIPNRSDEAKLAAAKPCRSMDVQMTEDTILDMARITVGTQDLSIDSPLQDAGMDSLTAVSFRNGLQQNLGVKISADLVNEFPTVREVAAHVKSKLGNL